MSMTRRAVFGRFSSVVTISSYARGAALLSDGRIVLIYPLPYYITFPLDRYRLIIEPILIVFALHLLTGFRAFKNLAQPRDSAAQVIHAV